MFRNPNQQSSLTASSPVVFFFYFFFTPTLDPTRCSLTWIAAAHHKNTSFFTTLPCSCTHSTLRLQFYTSDFLHTAKPALICTKKVGKILLNSRKLQRSSGAKTHQQNTRTTKLATRTRGTLRKLTVCFETPPAEAEKSGDGDD